MNSKDLLIQDLQKIIERQQKEIEDLEAKLTLFSPVTVPYPIIPHQQSIFQWWKDPIIATNSTAVAPISSEED